VVGLDEVDVLVCDSGLGHDDRAMLSSHVGRLLLAPVQSTVNDDGARAGHHGKEPVR
jgi:hypothetical protein